MKPPFRWDRYSDQPAVLRDGAFKREVYRRRTPDQIVTALESVLLLPLFTVAMPFVKPQKAPKIGRDFFGLCVNLDKGEAQYDLVKELGANALQMRIPLWDLNNLPAYRRFAEGFGSNVRWLVTLMQDRERAEDPARSAEETAKVVETFGDLCDEYQLGNAVNRTKWGFYSMGEYLRWYETIENRLRALKPDIKLIGPAVIDFEYHYVARALFNFRSVSFDRLGTLLYVDRRGAPQNAQALIFNLRRKIDLLYAMARFSPKCESRIYVTETNWPIQKTAPWAPTSEKECVSEADHARYLSDYYRIAAKSGKIERVYWHQLIAPGYGLVDSREGLRKREAFYAFKRLIEEYA